MNKIFRILLLVLFKISLLSTSSFANEEKIKIGLLVPLSGDNVKIGKQIIKSVRMALKDIGTNQIEIYPKDTKSDPNETFRSAVELEKMGINLIIGPVFYENLVFFEIPQNVLVLKEKVASFVQFYLVVRFFLVFQKIYHLFY